MFSFTLSSTFVDKYKDKQVPWGFTDAGGNSLGELTFIRTYSRLKEDGTKERWWETCERVINGMYSLQKDWVVQNRLEWNGHKAQASAQEAYDLLFNLKWTPPGRGLAQMGTDLVMKGKNAASLLNCAAVSTGDMEKHNPGYPFQWTTEALMLGIGVGFDTKGRGKFDVTQPVGEEELFVIPDTREGWGEAVSRLVNTYLKAEQKPVAFNYDEIRPYGAPIKTFGGKSSGPDPLKKGLEDIRGVLEENVGGKLTSKTITDIMNIIGTFVVSGNVRRSAELALGEADDEVFVDLKDEEKFPDRYWRWMSNNSISAHVGMDYSPFLERTVEKGEPGFIWLDVIRKHGRMIDPPDDKDREVIGMNPCAEQPLFSYEMCCLVEVHLNNIKSKEEFSRVLKFAYLYGKTVTLLTTPWPKTNAVMLRNRRIGLSLTGVASYVDNNSMQDFREMADYGYGYVNDLDKQYSNWLGIRESIRKTTGKPSGSVSLLSGATPGFHWSPGAKTFMRTVRFGEQDDTWRKLEDAGYRVEDDVASANTKVVYFPIKTDVKRSEKEVSIFEKVHLAATGQTWWSDNGISVTVTFDKEKESKHLQTVIDMYEGQLKAISFLPMDKTAYKQPPYADITEEEYESYIGKLKKVSTDDLYQNGVEAESEIFCTTDACEVRPVK